MFERPSVQNGAKMGITREEIKNLLKEVIEPLERKSEQHSQHNLSIFSFLLNALYF